MSPLSLSHSVAVCGRGITYAARKCIAKMTRDQLLPVNEESLPKQCNEDAFQLLGERKSLRNQQIQLIQKWLQENPQVNAHPDPRTIIFFLRGCKFDVDKAKKKIKW